MAASRPTLELGGLVGSDPDGRLARALGPSRRQPSPRDLLHLLDVVPPRFERSVPGRETFAWPHGQPDIVVKRHRGDLAREAWHERWRALSGLRGPVRSPGRREFENLAALREAGIPVPRPLAWVEDAAGRSLVVMEHVAHEETVRELLAAAGHDAAERWAARLAGLIARMHTAGWYHRDLYLQHWIVAANGAVVLLDVGRARHDGAPRRRWFVKDLGAMLHSTPAAVEAGTRLRFLARYLDARGILDWGERRVWARDVERRRRRIAAHRPRHDGPVPREVS